jgi:osmotically-inducible protein OsmY
MSRTSVLSSYAMQAVHQSSIPALRNLSVEESDTRVRITGSVTSYYLKQLAQEAVMPVLRDRELENQVEVVVP